MLTQVQVQRRAEAAADWLDGGIAAEIATMERHAEASEAWAARSPFKGGKRKAAALAEARTLREEAAQLRAHAGL